MSFHRRIRHGLLGFALSLLTFTAVSRADDGDEGAVKDLARRFYAAYAAKDLNAFMSLWSEKSPDYKDRKEIMTGVFAETGPIELKSLVVVWVRKDGDAASVRVRVELASNDRKTGKPDPSFGKLDHVIELIQEGGGWKVMRYVPSDMRLMERLTETKSKAERLRLLDGDADLIGFDFVVIVLNEGYAQAKRGQFSQASRLQDVAFGVAGGLGDRDALGLCHWYRGISLQQESRYEPALASYQKALTLLREAKDPKGEASTLNNIGKIYEATDHYAEALQQYRDSLTISRDLKDRELEAITLNNIGSVYSDTGRYAEALREYQDSLKIDRDLKDRAGEANTLNGIGIVYRDTGRYAEAVQQFQDSLTITRELKDRAGEANALNNIGIVYGDTGRFAETLQQYQESLKIFRDLKDRAGEAETLNGIGIVYRDTGRYAEAVQQFQDSLTITRELKDRAGEANALNNIGTVYGDTGRCAEALRQYQDSLKITRELGDRAGEASVLNNIGNIHEATGRYAQALQQYRDSLMIARELKDRKVEASTLSNIGNVYVYTGRYAEALQQYQDSLKIADPIGALGIAFLCHGNMGRAYQAQKQWSDAVGAYTEAVRITELLRTNTREPSLQSSLLAQKIDPFFYLAVCRLELNDPLQAFTVGERMKARGLVDILQQGKADLRRGMSDDESKQEQRLQNQVTALGVQLEGLRNRKADAAGVKALVGDLDKARQDYDAFRRELFLHRPELETRRAEFAPAGLDALGRSLFAGRTGLVVLSYLVGEKETLLFVLTAPVKEGDPARLTVYRIDVASKDLAEAVDAFRTASADPAAAVPDADDLYRWLLAPAADEMAAAKQVIVIPDGVLHTLPFQGLRDPDGKYLIEHFPVSYAPSVTALVKMEELGARRRKEYAGKPASLLALGVSDFGRRERPLPDAEKEARAVAASFGEGAKLLPGAEATLAKLEASWSGRRYLHFATHGRLNPDAPLYSSLVLNSGGDGDEGVLYARDLLDADVPAELVVMSACHTGEGRHRAGEGLLGLSWSWFAAGVPSTVASQWSVGDASTAQLMKAFYARLKAGDSKAEALRQAELTLLQDAATRHPFYWAPFVLVGDDK